MTNLLVIKGKVKEGAHRGAQMGFPTANVTLIEPLPDGIYISETTVEKKVYPSLTFIGKAETFKDSTYQSETYLLDTSMDLYGKEIKIQLLKKIRENKKFESSEELVLMMKKDEGEARVYFKLTQ